MCEGVMLIKQLLQLQVWQVTTPCSSSASASASSYSLWYVSNAQLLFANIVQGVDKFTNDNNTQYTDNMHIDELLCGHMHMTL